MSRFSGDYDEVIPPGLWQGALQRSLNSARGQGLLRELERSLLALPTQELVEGQVIATSSDDDDHRQFTGVCAIGAWALYRTIRDGNDMDDAVEYLADRFGGDDVSEFDTVDLAKSLGMGHTLAWELAWLNDEELGGLTPHERWQAVLDWVRERIHPEPVGSTHV